MRCASLLRRDGLPARLAPWSCEGSCLEDLKERKCLLSITHRLCGTARSQRSRFADGGLALSHLGQHKRPMECSRT